jgi:hypothetical protein
MINKKAMMIELIIIIVLLLALLIFVFLRYSSIGRNLIPNLLDQMKNLIRFGG